MMWGLSSSRTSAAWKPMSNSLLHRAEAQAGTWAAQTAASRRLSPLGPSHLCGVRWDRKLLLQQWSHCWMRGMDWLLQHRIPWSPGLISASAFLRMQGWRESPWLPPSCLTLLPAKWKTSPVRSTKHYSLVNWTRLTADSCSWNRFGKKQKLWSFQRWCSVYAALCANIPPELNKTISPC